MAIEISVVIPTYKRPLLLKNCLYALVQQEFDAAAYEVIVVSDGYDASTEEIVIKLSNQFSSLHYLHLPEKKGPAAARNLGWKKAEGILVAFTDDDTLPDRNWLKAYRSAYRGEDEIAFTGKIKVPLSAAPTDYEKNTAGLETAEFVTANCCCTKTALEKVQGFDERFSMAWREDSDLEFKFIQQNIPIRSVPDALIVHPVRKAPWGISIKEQKKGMFNALLYKKFPTLYREKIQPTPPWDYYLIVYSLWFMVYGLLSSSKILFSIGGVCWFVLTVRFISRRLLTTRKSFSHIMEMIVTSLIIPFVSVYWQLYGAWRYKVLFL